MDIRSGDKDDMYEDDTTKVKLNRREIKTFSVKVRVHQGSVFSLLLFTMVLEALSREFREGLPMELLYVDGRIKEIVNGEVEEVEKRDGSKGS